jgi:branched-chain amino acid transport system permease protein
VEQFIQFLGNGLTTGAIYALMAAGLTLVFGYMNIVNFAHGEFYMIGAYLAFATATTLGLGFVAGLLVAMAGVAVFGLLIHRFLLEPLRRHDKIEMPMLATIGLAIALPNVAIIIWGAVPVSATSPVSGETIDLGFMNITPQNLFVIATAAIALVVAHSLITWTRLGLIARATFQDTTASALMGVHVVRIQAGTFAFGAMLAAISGVLISTVFQITPTMGVLATSKAFAVVILGGLGSFPGAITGGLILGVVESLGGGYISTGYKDAFGLLVLIAALLLRPQGLFGSAKTVQE